MLDVLDDPVGVPAPASGFYGFVESFCFAVGPARSPVEARREGQECPGCGGDCCAGNTVRVVYRRIGQPIVDDYGRQS